MEITILDFILINCLSYIGGLGTGLLLCCKYKDNFMVRSRSRDNLNNDLSLPSTTPTVIASAPPPQSREPLKITLE